MIRRHGDIAGILRERALSEADRAYLQSAMTVVAPVTDLPIELPPGRRDAYPERQAAMNDLAEPYGVLEACRRLVSAAGILARAPDRGFGGAARG
jgi:hypothetical protein